jgi:hypothetical protein
MGDCPAVYIPQSPVLEVRGEVPVLSGHMSHSICSRRCYNFPAIEIVRQVPRLGSVIGHRETTLVRKFPAVKIFGKASPHGRIVVHGLPSSIREFPAVKALGKASSLGRTVVHGIPVPVFEFPERESLR